MNLDRLDWTLCRSFLAIIREGSLSGAARVLGVAHPTIRRHLDELEATLRGTLFIRSPSGLVPTSLAERLREPAEAMESAADALIRSASGEVGEISGTVRITASEVMGVEVLPPLLASIKAANPGLNFELVLTNTVQDLLRRDADIAVRMTRPTQPDLVARKIGETTLGIHAHQAWVAAHGEPASLAALVQARQLVGFDRRDPGILGYLAAQGIAASDVDFCFRSDSDLAQLAAIRAGLGAGICQTKIAEREVNLVRLLPDVGPRLEVWLVIQTSNRSIGRMRVVFDALAEALRRFLA